MSDNMSEEMDKFLDELDHLCWKYKFEIWATEKANAINEDGSYPTFVIHGNDGETTKLIYVDGDGRGK